MAAVPDAIASLFESPRSTLQWGREGIDELDAACRAFLKTAAHRFYTDVDPDTGQHIKKFQLIDRVPDNIVRRTTETLQHIRHSFDQSFYGAVRAIRGGRAKLVIFPWVTDPGDLENRLGHRDFPPELHPIIRSFEPYGRGKAYPGGHDVVRAMAQIAGRKKHTINLAASATVHSVRHPSVIGTWKGPFPFRMPIPVWDPVKQEMEIFRWMPGSDVYNDSRVAVVISLNEATPLDGVPVVGSLEVFLKKANAALEGFEREAKRIVGV